MVRQRSAVEERGTIVVVNKDERQLKRTYGSPFHFDCSHPFSANGSMVTEHQIYFLNRSVGRNGSTISIPYSNGRFSCLPNALLSSLVSADGARKHSGHSYTLVLPRVQRMLHQARCMFQVRGTISSALSLSTPPVPILIDISGPPHYHINPLDIPHAYST